MLPTSDVIETNNVIDDVTTLLGFGKGTEQLGPGSGVLVMVRIARKKAAAWAWRTLTRLVWRTPAYWSARATSHGTRLQGLKNKKNPFSQPEFQIKSTAMLKKKKFIVSLFFQRGVPCCRVSRRGSQIGGPIGASLERRRWWRRERTVFPLPQPDVDQCGLRAGARAEAPCRD